MMHPIGMRVSYAHVKARERPTVVNISLTLFAYLYPLVKLLPTKYAYSSCSYARLRLVMSTSGFSDACDGLLYWCLGCQFKRLSVKQGDVLWHNGVARWGFALPSSGGCFIVRRPRGAFALTEVWFSCRFWIFKVTPGQRTVHMLRFIEDLLPIQLPPCSDAAAGVGKLFMRECGTLASEGV